MSLYAPSRRHVFALNVPSLAIRLDVYSFRHASKRSTSRAFLLRGYYLSVVPGVRVAFGVHRAEDGNGSAETKYEKKAAVNPVSSLSITARDSADRSLIFDGN